MSVERWLEYTDGGVTSIRSSRLKAVDAALAQYHRSPKNPPPNLDGLRSALVAWIQELGAGWKTNARNRYHAVDDLYKEVMGIAVQKSGAEMVALSHLQDESRVLVDELFRGRKLEWRSDFLGKLGDRKWEAVFTVTNESVGAGAGVDEAIRGNDAIGPTAQRGAAPVAKNMAWAVTMRERMLLELVPAAIRHDVLIALARVFPDFMERLVASIMPFAGVLVSGGVLLKDLSKVALESHHLNRTRTHVLRSLAVADPEAAMHALITILARERNASALEASLSFAEFGTKLAGMLVDGGAATSAASGAAMGVVKLMNIIRVIVRDVQEKNAANKAMAQGVDLTIFQTNPLVGAYYVCCVPTSALVNEIYTRWWHPGWRGDVERTVVKHLEPIRDRARHVIREHRFVIAGLERYPGVLTRNDKELEAMMKGRVTPALKDRIVGFDYAHMPPGLKPTHRRR